MNQPNQDQPTLRYRPLIIILFAAILLLITGVAKSQDEPAVQESLPTPIIETLPPVGDSPVELNGDTHLLPAHPEPLQGRVDQVVFEQREIRRQQLLERASMRPRYAELTASLANFDADADPDGWSAEVVLRDSMDRAVLMRAQATFELIGRVPLVVTNDYVDSGTQPARWSMDLDFDADGVARFKLPLRNSLKPSFGWTGITHPRSGSRSNISPHRRSSGFARRGPSRLSHPLRSDWENLRRPQFGELTVRVSVPTEGVFKAAAPVQIRPTVLVDTHWPYR